MWLIIIILLFNLFGKNKVCELLFKGKLRREIFEEIDIWYKIF